MTVEEAETKLRVLGFVLAPVEFSSIWPHLAGQPAGWGVSAFNQGGFPVIKISTWAAALDDALAASLARVEEYRETNPFKPFKPPPFELKEHASSLRSRRVGTKK